MMMNFLDDSLLRLRLHLLILLTLAPALPLSLLLQGTALLRTQVVMRMMPVIRISPSGCHIERVAGVDRRGKVLVRVGVVGLLVLQGIGVSFVLVWHGGVSVPVVGPINIFVER